MITVITPVYNEENNLEELHSRIKEVFARINEKYELLFVDNGSNDNSLELIKKIKKNDPNVKFISLTKNFGHQGGIWAGLYHAHGTCIIMDADLQHPPESIEEIVLTWKKGFKVVNTQKKLDLDARLWKRYLSTFFYFIVNKLTNLKLTHGQSDFCLLDSQVLEVIKKLPERKTFLRGLVNSLGYNYSTVKYSCKRRKKGKSKFSLTEYVNLAFDGIISFSILPITVFFWSGLFIATICLLYVFYLVFIIAKALIDVGSELTFSNILTSGELIAKFPPGWATLTIAILFIGSVQLIGLGILGKYVAHTLENVKKRPEFIVKEKSE